ncbi:EF-hand domain-containing protein [Streptomonospora nanhaiensis]|uniref:Calmodulin n=1 Tax=Streptomonospora nanhaiensis TaxID=1323731 RepID=A0A853BLT1_9ACTN|nr:EF-hand domain-containing protein [Streptomonospora nanhaiensis]MBV2365733.1 EF-hand domain-containing protein [Streptomonospora nanhaiensis]MBX9387543.1 EF-hand domain-containing protein [Streptomonospora nanhaiensis]NYI96529.1 calmodulin [Streptomonospora nanhaiensis]
MADSSEYAETFALVDSDDDGLISADEFADLLARLGQERDADRAAAAVAALDSDGDGRVSLAEFTRYMAQNA